MTRPSKVKHTRNNNPKASIRQVFLLLVCRNAEALMRQVQAESARILQLLARMRAQMVAARALAARREFVASVLRGPQQEAQQPEEVEVLDDAPGDESEIEGEEN